MKKIIKKPRNRRGFSLVEVVVALTVIVIMSGAAITLINTHTDVQVRTIQTTEAANIAENAIECFRFAKDTGEFKTSLEKTTVSLEGENGNYKVIKNGVTVIIEITDNTIKVSAQNKNNEIILDEISYTK